MYLVIAKRILALLCLFVLCYFSLSQIYLDIVGFRSDTGQIRDVVQDYIASKALKSGQDPYQRLDYLHSVFAHEDATPMFTHPTPHTPYAIFLFSQFGFDNVNDAIIIWYAMQFVVYSCFFWFIAGQIKFLQSFKSLRFMFVVVMMGADPVRMELILGQWNFILLILVLIHVFVKEEYWLAKAISLISAVLIKSVGLGHLLYDLLNFRIRNLLFYIAFFIVANYLLIIFHFYPEWIMDYYRNVAPNLSRSYLIEPANGSLLASIAGLLSTQFEIGSVHAALSLLVVICLAVILCVKSRSILDRDLRVFYLWTLSLLLLPVSWAHCLVLLLPSVGKILPRLRYQSLTELDKIYGILLVFFWYFIRQPGLALMEFLEKNKHLINFALNISGVWLSIYLVLVLIFIVRLDKASALPNQT